MAKHVVARASEIPEGGRIIVDLQGRSVGIFHVNGRFYAVLNRCPHRGAELCRGSVLGRLDADVPGHVVWSKTRPMLRCPWHGWEYDLETGRSYFDSSARAYPIDVEHGDQVNEELEAGAVQAEPRSGVVAEGLAGPRLRAGPFTAEAYPVTVEDDYIVVTLPGGGARRRPRAESSSQ